MSTAVEELVNGYYRWLKDSTKIKAVGGDGWIEVQTPFLDRHNDFIQIYVRPLKDNVIELTDDSHVLSDLAMGGGDVDSTPKRRQILETILCSHGVKRVGDELTATCKAQDFAWRKHNFVQAILEVNDLFNLSRTSVLSLFVEDVMSWFDSHQIPFTPNLKVVGHSGLDHHFDLALPRTRAKKERLIRAINKLDRNTTIRMTHSAMDLQEVRADAQTVAIVNDAFRKPQSDMLEALDKCDIETVLWSKRDQYLGELAA